MTSMSSHLQGIMKNPVSDAERTRRRVARLETRQGKDAGVSESQGVVEFDPNGLQYTNEAYSFEAPNPIYIKPLFADYIVGSAAEGFPFEVIGAGSFSRGNDDAEGHYGVFTVTQNGANTGALARPNTNAISNMKIWNGFIFECVFEKLNSATANIFVQGGFMDSLTSADSTDGIYFEYETTVGVTFYVIAGGVVSDSQFTTNDFSGSDWTKVRIEVQPGGEMYGKFTNRDGTGGGETTAMDASSAIDLTAVPMIKAFKTNAGTIDLARFDYVACWSPFQTRW